MEPDYEPSVLLVPGTNFTDAVTLATCTRCGVAVIQSDAAVEVHARWHERFALPRVAEVPE